MRVSGHGSWSRGIDEPEFETVPIADPFVPYADDLVAESGLTRGLPMRRPAGILAYTIRTNSIN